MSWRERVNLRTDGSAGRGLFDWPTHAVHDATHTTAGSGKGPEQETPKHDVFVARSAVHQHYERPVQEGSAGRPREGGYLKKLLARLGKVRNSPPPPQFSSPPPQSPGESQLYLELEKTYALLSEREEDLRAAAEIGQSLLARVTRGEEENAELRDALASATVSNPSVDPSARVNGHKMELLEEKLRASEDIISSLSSELTVAEEEVSQYKARLAAVPVNENQDLHEKIEALESELGASICKAAEHLRANSRLLGESASLQHEAALLKEEINAESEEKRELKAALVQHHFTESQVNDLKKEAALLFEEKDKLLANNIALEKNVGALHNQNTQIVQQLEEEKKMRMEAQSELKARQETVASPKPPPSLHQEMQTKVEVPAASVQMPGPGVSKRESFYFWVMQTKVDLAEETHFESLSVPIRSPDLFDEAMDSRIQRDDWPSWIRKKITHALGSSMRSPVVAVIS